MLDSKQAVSTAPRHCRSTGTYLVPALLVLSCIAADAFARSGQQPDSNIRPSAEQQAAMLAAMGRYAEQYFSNLPNFLCLLVTEQFQANKKGEHWHQGDTLTALLAFNEGREHRTLQLVNDKPVRQVSRRWRTPLRTEGEFGDLLERIFNDNSKASFDWSRWETIRGKRLTVFDYSIDKQHSTLKLSLSDLASAIVPYRGSVYADPDTGAILRVNDSASEIPPEIQTREIGTSIDYAEVTISAAKYLLPLHATILMKTDREQVRNELNFQNYRKFGAESSLILGGDEQPPTPKP